MTEEQKLRVELAERGIKAGQLAALAGVRPQVVYNILTGSCRYWPPKEAINRALGMEIFTRQEPQKRGRKHLPPPVTIPINPPHLRNENTPTNQPTHH